MYNITSKLAELKDSQLSLLEYSRNILVGRSIKILSDYNGQTYGKSKPSLKGKIKVIAHVSITDCRLYVAIEGFLYSCGLEIEEWELVKQGD